jgi:hypothetical protein
MSYSPTPLVRADAHLRQRSLLGQVYAWMTAGLLVTSAVATYATSAPIVQNLIYGNPVTIWVLFAAQIALVIGLNAAINRLAPLAAVGLFIAYAALNGLTLSAIFLVYTSTSIAQTFLATAATFGAMSLYGATTKRMAVCQHLDDVDMAMPRGDGCVECLNLGDSWASLRLCMSFSYVGELVAPDTKRSIGRLY